MRAQMFRTMIVSALMVASGAVAFSGPAVAHEKGILRPASRRFVAGGTVELLGRQFEKKVDLSLVLIGTRGRRELLKVRTDSLGEFTVELAIPAQTIEAEYRLAAIAADGDVVSSVDVVVVAGALGSPSDAEAHAGHEDGGAEMMTAEPLALKRARRGIVTTGVVIFAVVSIFAGGLLLRRRVVDE